MFCRQLLLACSCLFCRPGTGALTTAQMRSTGTLTIAQLPCCAFADSDQPQ